MKCPKCGSEGTLTYSLMYQVSHVYKIKKDGTISKKYRKSPECSEEWGFLSCNGCGYAKSDMQDAYDIIDGKVVIQKE